MATLIQSLRDTDKWRYVSKADERQKQGAQFGTVAKATIFAAGFGRDWRRGFKNPAIKVSLQDIGLTPQQEPLTNVA